MSTAQQLLIYGSGAAAITEFVPTIKYASISSSTSRGSTTYGSLLTFTISTANISDCLNLVFSACGNMGAASGGTPIIQITVDGVDVGTTAVTAPHAGMTWTCNRVVSVSGLSVGSHTVVVNWKGSNTTTLTIDPTGGVHHAWIVGRLATGTIYATRATNATSTATSPTDSLISTTYTSIQGTSALYIRFSSCGVTNSAGLTAKFRIFVDSVAVCGAGAMSDGASFAYCAGAVVVVAVSAGSHTVELKWGGGSSSGSTITVASEGQHAALLIDEVNTGSPRIAKCTTDISGAADITSASITTPAGGSSDILIESTASPAQSGSASAQISLVVDGSTVQQSKRGGDNSAGTEGLFMLYATTGLSAAAHTAVLHLVGASGGLNCSTNPDFAHGNVVVWPVTIQP